MQSPIMQSLLEIDRAGDVAVCRFVRRTILDPDTVEGVGDRLRALIREDGVRKLVLNFSRVESLTSAMLGKFIGLHREMEAASGQLVFCQVDPFLEQIFTLCGIPRQIPLFPDESAALAALGKPAEADSAPSPPDQ